MVIVVFMDKLPKMAHLTPCKKEVNGAEYVKLFIDNVFQHHSLPKVILSNQRPYFNRNFWGALLDFFGVDL